MHSDKGFTYKKSRYTLTASIPSNIHDPQNRLRDNIIETGTRLTHAKNEDKV